MKIEMSRAVFLAGIGRERDLVGQSRRDQSGLSYLQAPAGRMTFSRGYSRDICRKLSVAMSWLKTLPVAAAGSLREVSRRLILMAIRC